MNVNKIKTKVFVPGILMFITIIINCKEKHIEKLESAKNDYIKTESGL